MRARTVRVIILSFAAAVIASLLLVTRPGGSFLMLVPGLSHAVKGLYLAAGYDLVCYDIHGGFQCEKHESEAAIEARREKARLDFEEKFGCRTDADCHSLPGGGCVTGSVGSASFGALGGPGRCKCLHGPVFFGCTAG